MNQGYLTSQNFSTHFWRFSSGWTLSEWELVPNKSTAMSWFCRLPQWVDWFPEKNPWEKSHGSHGFRCSDFPRLGRPRSGARKKRKPWRCRRDTRGSSKMVGFTKWPSTFRRDGPLKYDDFGGGLWCLWQVYHIGWCWFGGGLWQDHIGWCSLADGSKSFATSPKLARYCLYDDKSPWWF